MGNKRELTDTGFNPVDDGAASTGGIEEYCGNWLVLETVVTLSVDVGEYVVCDLNGEEKKERHEIRGECC